MMKYIEQEIVKYIGINKGEKIVQTIIEPLTFKRRYYTKLDESGEESRCYLLDEMLNIELIGKDTLYAVLRMIETARNISYRESKIDMGQKNIEVSHQTIENRVIDFEEKVKEIEKERIRQYI